MSESDNILLVSESALSIAVVVVVVTIIVAIVLKEERVTEKDTMMVIT